MIDGFSKVLSRKIRCFGSKLTRFSRFIADLQKTFSVNRKSCRYFLKKIPINHMNWNIPPLSFTFLKPMKSPACRRAEEYEPQME